MGLAMAEQMSPSAKPALGLTRLQSAKEGVSRPSQMASSMEEIQYSDGSGKTGAVDPPKPRSAVAEPDDKRSGIHPLAGGFELQGRDEIINGAQYCHQSASQQLGDSLSRARDPSAEAGQNADFYLPLLNRTRGCLRRGPKRHHHP